MPKSTKATKAPAKAKATKAKATKAQAKTPIKVLDKDFVFGGEGTKRRESWDALAKQKGTKTREAYLAAGGLAKYLPRWRKAGAIDYSMA